MALCRCKNHKPYSTKNEYIDFVEPLSFGNGSIICGRKKCENEGVIWITKSEFIQYSNGMRIFHFPTAVCKVKVK